MATDTTPEYRRLGRSGLQISSFALGTFNFGGHTPEDQAHRILDIATDRGLNMVDTANTYPGPIVGDFADKGRGEEIIGRWIGADTTRRERIVLATKVFGEMGPGVNDKGLSARSIRHALDASLRRLQTDHIDLYQFHHVDRTAPWDEIWEAIDVAVRQGKVLYAGSSNFAGWHLAQAQESARRRLMIGLVSEQALYNLLVRDIERELVPAALEYGTSIIAWSPLHSGLLAGPRREGSRRSTARPATTLATRAAELAQYEQLADDTGIAPWRLALGWVVSRPGVATALIGPRTVEHLEQLLDAWGECLDADIQHRLDELFPGPKTAPEDHAW